jgi:CelD/BcsL family acetyltransferase involved in cellulose biosynthesis
MSIAALDPAAELMTPLMTGATTQPFAVTITEDFGEARAIWEALAAEGHTTPYQQFRFCEAFFRHVEAGEGASAVLISVHDASETPIMLLPLSIRRVGPVRIARFIGGEHANFSMPVCGHRAAALRAGDIRALLQDVARRAGIDLYAFRHQPGDWQGFANPLALIGGQPSPSFGHKLELQADAEALFRALQSKDTRRKLRQKETKLAAMGRLDYRRAETAEEARAILATFHDLRAARFAAQGIDNPFASRDIHDFLDEAVTAGLDSGTPPVELHALMLDDRAIAIFGMVTDQTRISGLLTAFDTSGDLARYSPGDILLNRMIAECCARGFRTFDLGAGEAHYKDKVCKDIEPLTDAVIPATLAGRAAGAVLRLAIGLKRGLKQSDLGQRLIATYRTWKARA